MEIKRIRYVVVNENKTEIFCGLAKNYQFKPIDDIGDTAIKTYVSEKKAQSSFLSSWWNSKKEDFETEKYKVLTVTETIESIKIKR